MTEQLASEREPPGEREATQRIIDLLKQRMLREYPSPKRTLRDAHPKQHGILRAEFIVDSQLPSDLRVGLFAEARTYHAWVRFSNMSDPPGPDSNPDSRGMAIKVMGVGGTKILENEKHAKTHDFVLMSTNFFVTKDVAQFAKLVESLEKGKFWLLLHLLLHPYLLLLFLRARRRCASVLEIPYGSTTPYAFAGRAVKYMAFPQNEATAVIPANPSEDFLKEQMVKHLNDREVSFDFSVQFQTDTVQMPIEDPRVIWNDKLSPWRKVATIRIPLQQFDTPAQHEFGDNLSFTPWHALPEHKPLGGINRARRVIYETMSNFRHTRNVSSREEPVDWIDF